MRVVARVAVYTGPRVLSRNMEHLVYEIPSGLSSEFDVDLVGLEETSPRIEESFSRHVSIRRARWPGWLRGLTTIPVGYINLARYIKANRPDVVLTLSGIGINGLVVGLAGRRFGIPTVNRVTSDIFKVWWHKGGVFGRLSLFVRNNVLGRLSIRLSTKVVILHRDFRSRFRSKSIQNKLVAIPQPMAFPDADPNQARNIREGLGIPADARVASCIGRLAPDKNIPLLLRVAKRAMEERSDLHVIIAGSGPLEETVRRAARSESRFHVLGEIERGRVPAILQASDVFLSTARPGGEGLSTAIAEAIHFNVPVVATASGPGTLAMVPTASMDETALVKGLVDESTPQGVMPENMDPADNAGCWRDLVRSLIEDRVTG